jgi:hypothetical protein
VAVRTRVDQLSVDTHPTASTLHTPFEHVRHAERLGDLAQITLSADFVLHCGRAADYFQVRYLGQAGENFVLYTVCEVSILFLVTQISERKNGDALLGNGSRRAINRSPANGRWGRQS